MHDVGWQGGIGAHSIAHLLPLASLALEFVCRPAPAITSLGVQQQRLQGGSSSSDGARSTHATSGRH